MNPRRWSATALLLAAACMLLWWTQRGTHDRQRTVKEELRSEQFDAGSDHAFNPAGGEPPVEEMRAAPQPVGSAEQATTPSGDATAPMGQSRVVSQEIAPVPPKLPKGTGAEIEQQLDQVNLMLRDYRTLAGENPVGTNAEIMKALMGENVRGARLGPPPGQGLNAQGELLDPWGTPYFFHQISGREMEVRSAGPDEQLWTPDDQTVRSVSAGGQ